MRTSSTTMFEIETSRFCLQITLHSTHFPVFQILNVIKFLIKFCRSLVPIGSCHQLVSALTEPGGLSPVDQDVTSERAALCRNRYRSEIR